MKLNDLPDLSPNLFYFKNSCDYYGIIIPCRVGRNIDKLSMVVESGFWLVGKCIELPENSKKENTIGIMVFSDDTGEVWQHFPAPGKKLWDRLEIFCKNGILDNPIQGK